MKTYRTIGTLLAATVLAVVGLAGCQPTNEIEQVKTENADLRQRLEADESRIAVMQKQIGDLKFSVDEVRSGLTDLEVAKVQIEAKRRLTNDPGSSRSNENRELAKRLGVDAATVRRAFANPFDGVHGAYFGSGGDQLNKNVIETLNARAKIKLMQEMRGNRQSAPNDGHRSTLKMCPDGSWQPGNCVLCPDGHYRAGTSCVMAPNGKWVGR